MKNTLETMSTLDLAAALIGMSAMSAVVAFLIMALAILFFAALGWALSLHREDY